MMSDIPYSFGNGEAVTCQARDRRDVASVLRALLDGADPDHLDLSALTQEVSTLLVEAYQVGGTCALRRQWETLARCDPGLASAVAGESVQGDPEPSVHSASAAGLLDAAGLMDLNGKSLDEVATALRRAVQGVKAAKGDAVLRVTVREEAIARLTSAKIVGSPARLVDAALGGLTAEGEQNDRQGQALALTVPESWPDPVDGRELLAELEGVVTRYVALPQGGATATALWALFTYVHDASVISPNLGLSSPEKRCGKTTLLSIIGQLVRRAVPASNISTAALFRSVEEYSPTLLIDEAETFIGEREEMRGILNAGHQRANAYVIRTVGDDHQPRIFSTWCPKAFALIGRLPETLEDRSIVIPMRRRVPGEEVERLRLDRLDLGDTCRKMARWAADHLEALRTADPGMPEELNDRAADNWRPLLAIADLVGGDWPTRARKASEVLSVSSRDGDGDSSVRTLLLQDVRDLFELHRTDQVSSEQILKALDQMDDRPWPEWKRGQPITQRGVAKLLEPFGVRPKQLWFSREGKKRGYIKADFEDVWKRYLDPPRPDPPVPSGRTGISIGGQQVASEMHPVGEDNPTGCKSPVNDCGTTDLPVLPDRDPSYGYFPGKDSPGRERGKI